MAKANARAFLDCRTCGAWTLPVFWEVRNDTDYRTLR